MCLHTRILMDHSLIGIMMQFRVVITNVEADIVYSPAREKNGLNVKKASMSVTNWIKPILFLYMDKPVQLIVIGSTGALVFIRNTI
jgi:hypothetical protein